MAFTTTTSHPLYTNCFVRTAFSAAFTAVKLGCDAVNFALDLHEGYCRYAEWRDTVLYPVVMPRVRTAGKVAIIVLAGLWAMANFWIDRYQNCQRVEPIALLSPAPEPEATASTIATLSYWKKQFSALKPAPKLLAPATSFDTFNQIARDTFRSIRSQFMGSTVDQLQEQARSLGHQTPEFLTKEDLIDWILEVSL